MKFLKTSISSLLVLGYILANPVYADLGSELEAVHQAEVQGQRAAAKAAKARAAAAKAKADALALEKKRELALEYKERMDDKKRDQSFEDEMRKLQIEEMKLELARKKARISREDDFIDQELKREAARTDVIQSDADAQRSISRGTESLLIKEGEARVKKESGFFK